jgi:hypothetical protein
MIAVLPAPGAPVMMNLLIWFRKLIDGRNVEKCSFFHDCAERKGFNSPTSGKQRKAQGLMN